VSEDFVKRHRLESKAVEILGQEMVTDTPSSFTSKSDMKLVGADMTRIAAERLYKKTGIWKSFVNLITHDSFQNLTSELTLFATF